MEPSEKPPTPPPEATEDDLSNLLDSCIDDFNKPLPKTATPNPAKAAKTVAKPADSAADWSAEFKEFSDVMGNFIGDESEMDEIKKLMEGCMEGLPQMDDENFANSFADTIRHLTEQAQNVPETSPEDLANLLGNLDVGGDGDSMQGLENMPELMPLMQGVMQKLMSKELLYPSIKEIVDKYPAWLEEHRATLDQSELKNYEKQFELMKVICEEFEKDDESASEEEKKRQFETVLQLMQKVQTYGNPPKELVANIGPGVPLDEQGNLQIPGMPGNCVVM